MIGILDFDGTLVDSYSVIPSIYEEIRQKLGLDEGFVDGMLLIEEIGDYFGIFEREKFLKLIFKENYEEILDMYWEIRNKNSVILPGTIEFLEKNRERIDLYLVTSKDDTIEIKKKRIKSSGLEKYFKDILIYGEGEFKSIRDCIEYIKDIDKILFYVDDKNINLNKVKDYGINLYKRIFYPPFPFKLAWKYPKINVKEILSLQELENYINI